MATSMTREPTATRGVADLFARRYADMVRVATLMVGSNAVAEELVQDAFVRVQRNWGRIEGEPDGYLYRAVTNTCRSHLRRRQLERAFRPDPRPADAVPEPDGVLPYLEHLSPRRRVAIVLRYYADLPDDAIAEALECRPATVRSLVHRGLQQLREVIDHG